MSIALGTNRVDIENMILSTFLLLNDLAQDGEIENDLFVLDDLVFTSPFRKKTAKRINEVEDEAYSFLSYELENSIKGTQYETDWISILSSNSYTLGLAKKYHDDLLKKTKLRMIQL